MIETKVFAAIYARQSSGEENESASVEQQITTCQDIAKKNGYEVIAVESDRNISGRTYPDIESAIAFSQNDIVYQNYIANETRRKKYRKGLGKIFEILSKIDILIVYDSTRLMRPLTDSYLESYVKQNFISNKVKLQTKDSLIQFDDFSANIVNALENRVNDNQIIICKQKSQAALQKLQNEGYAISGTSCLGFRSCGKQKVEIIKSEIEIVKTVFMLMAKRKPLIEIIRKINNLPHIHRKYCYSDIYKICHRLCYCGLTRNSKGEIIESKVYPKIIPFDIFQKVQDRLNDKKHKNYDKTSIHPLSTLVYCGYCKRKMIICKSTPFPNSKEKGAIYYYVCMDEYSRKSVDELCRLATIRESYQLEDKNGLKECILPLLITEIKKEIIEKSSRQIDKDSLLIEKENIERLERILDQKLVNGDITESDYNTRFAEYNNRKKTIQATLINSENNTSELKEEIKILLLYISVANKINDDFYKYIAIKYIKEILVFNEYITVVMHSGFTVNIERIRVYNSRVLPTYSLNDNGDKYELVYYYKTADIDNTETIIAESDFLRVITVGKNPKPFEYLKKRNQIKRLGKSKKYQTIKKAEQ